MTIDEDESECGNVGQGEPREGYRLVFFGGLGVRGLMAMTKAGWNRESTGIRFKTYASWRTLSKTCDEYFENCEIYKKTATIPGLALYLGLGSRFDLYALQRSEDTEIAHTVSRAMLRIEHERNAAAVNGDGKIGGPIFDLKANFDYSESGPADGGKGAKDDGITPLGLPRAKDMFEWMNWWKEIIEEGKDYAKKAEKQPIDVTPRKELPSTEKTVNNEQETDDKGEN